MNRTEELVEQIKYYADAYYAGKEEISDKEYDALIEELRVLDPENPLIAGMAGDEDEYVANAAGYKKMNHILTTGTLDKAMELNVFEKWCKTHNKYGYHISSKMDGCSQELVYENGSLIHMISRGDGYTGYDKLSLTKYLKVPANVPANFTGSIRGEFELSNKGFKSHKVFEKMKNPRNAGSGLLNKKAEDLKPEEIDAMKEMKFFAYDVKTKDRTFKSKTEVFEFLSSVLGFDLPVWRTAKTYDEVVKFREELSKDRGTEKEEFAIDGIVVFEDIFDEEDQKEKVQKNAIAVKFDLMVAEGTILDIEWSMAGAYLTPVAIMTPMYLDGTTVQRANLCNLNIIQKLGIKIGDKVRVVKRGEIIPQVLCKVS